VKQTAPNVLFIVLENAGYGHLGCYGSPIRTPNLDRLARGGLRFSNMHTQALCSPSRSCIITGRNQRENALAWITEVATRCPESNGDLRFENGLLSEILLSHGYNTFALGKWPLTPKGHGPAGPGDGSPLGRGFERFYGFSGEAHRLTEDLVDRAIEFVADARQVAADKPFFMYFCTGAMQAPHHVPAQWADRYRGHFDDGWDAYRDKVFRRQIELGLVPANSRPSDRDREVLEWHTLADEERRLHARRMEAFAGQLEFIDHQIGRLLSFLERIDQLENTLIMVVSDNGAAERGPERSSAGWAWAGSCPFRHGKDETYRGGTSDPFIVHWPAGITANGRIRHQYAHVIDMVPTVLEAIGIEAPRTLRGVPQSPIQGISFAQTFRDPRLQERQLTEKRGSVPVSVDARMSLVARLVPRVGALEAAVATRKPHQEVLVVNELIA
jgi:arylsulfatase A-like enzyme